MLYVGSGVLFSIIYLRFFARALFGNGIFGFFCFLVCFAWLIELVWIISAMLLYGLSMSYGKSGAETWTMRKHERRKIDAFELWCWRRVLRVSWMERKTNISIIENIKPELTRESRVTKAALSYFGHVVRAGEVEDGVMLGRMKGARKRGRPRQRWLDTLKGYTSGATISKMRRDARDREGWRGTVTTVARGRKRLGDTR